MSSKTHALVVVVATVFALFIASPAQAARLRLGGLGGLGVGITAVEDEDSKTGFGGIFRLSASIEASPKLYVGVYYGHARSSVDSDDTVLGETSATIRPSGIGAIVTLKMPSLVLEGFGGYAFGSFAFSVNNGGLSVTAHSDISGFQLGGFAGYDIGVSPNFAVQLGPLLQYSRVSAEEGEFFSTERSANHFLITLALQGTFDSLF